MARRKKPTVTEGDPSYSHQFKSFRPVETDMPPDVKIPNLEPKDESVQKRPKKEPAKKDKTSVKVSKPKPEENKTLVKVKRTGDRQVTLDAAVKITQKEEMKPLLNSGLKFKDIVTLAGKKAVAQFEATTEFVPKQEADRCPMKEGYHSSKRLPNQLLDSMRSEHDPLGVSSDSAMIRGQFEPLFWQVLDEVIVELKEKFL